MSCDAERLARLEETLFFQERLLDELNQALTVQQRSIDKLEAESASLRERVLELSLMLEAGGGADAGPPPHYGPGR